MNGYSLTHYQIDPFYLIELQKPILTEILLINKKRLT